MLVRRVLSGVVTGTAVVALAACGGASQGTDGVAANLSSDSFAAEMSSATAEATSTHIEGEVSFLGETMTMSGDLSTAADLDDFLAEVTLRMPDQGRVTMRVVDNVIYLAGNGISSNPAKPWAKIELEDPDNPLGAFYQRLMANTNPAQAARMFEAVTELDNEGTDSIDGVQATHYSVTVDLVEALKIAGLADSLGAGTGWFGTDIPDAVTYDVWLETDTALPVRMTMDLQGMTMDLRFSDWGDEVAVAAPAASRVTVFDF